MYNCGLVVLMCAGKQQKGGKMPFARPFYDRQTALWYGGYKARIIIYYPNIFLSL